MMHNEPPPPPPPPAAAAQQHRRLTTRQQEAGERRLAMTQRRDQMTRQIRKVKKSTYLARKRGLLSTSSTTTTISSTTCNNGDGDLSKRLILQQQDFSRLLQTYLNCPTLEHLQNIHLALKEVIVVVGMPMKEDMENNENPLVILEQHQKTLAMQFLMTVRDNHRHFWLSNNDNEPSLWAAEVDMTPFRLAMEILVQLTSIHQQQKQSYYDTQDDNYNYYRSMPVTWTELVVMVGWLDTLAKAMTTLVAQPKTTPSTVTVTIVELICIVVGNIFGESQAPYLSTTENFDDNKPAWVATLIQAVSITPIAAWTLTNMIQNDSSSSPSSALSSSLVSKYCSDTLLSPTLLREWLQEPTLTTQTAWMLVSLTAATTREPNVVTYLCQQHMSLPFTLVQTLAQSYLYYDDNNPMASPDSVIEPLLEALGNIACHASMVPPLLWMTTDNATINATNTPTIQQFPPTTSPPQLLLLPLLQQMLSQTRSSRCTNNGHYNHNNNHAKSYPPSRRILTLVAWVAGCLLVDTGLDQHPSTTLAAPTLIPILMERLARSGTGSNNRTDLMILSLEEEREMVLALWNAFSWPPTNSNNNDMDLTIHPTTPIQQRQNHPPPPLQAVVQIEKLPVKAMLPTLVRLAQALNDPHAVLASVHVLQLTLHGDLDARRRCARCIRTSM
jgi:hypothetical protein